MIDVLHRKIKKLALPWIEVHFMCSVVISTKSGLVRGKIQSSAVSGIKVQKFLNIPYAETPVGRLRFEKPQPKKPWKGNISVLKLSDGHCFFVYVQKFRLSSNLRNFWNFVLSMIFLYLPVKFLRVEEEDIWLWYRIQSSQFHVSFDLSVHCLICSLI